MIEQNRTDPIVTGGTATTTSALLIAANPARTRMIIHNADGTNAISILPVTSSITHTFGVAGSIKIGASGTLMLDGVTCTSGLSVIASAGTAKVSVWEF